MTRKHLPKAIRRNSKDLQEIAAVVIPDEELTTRPSAPFQLVGETTEPATGSASSEHSAQAELVLPAPVNDNPQAARRRKLARKIVERHRTYAAVGGLLPLPIVTIATITAIVMRMVRQLTVVYGVPFEHDRTRAMIAGLIGGAAPTGVGAATASTLAFAAPAGAVVGLAVSALAAGALTRAIGQVFVESLEHDAKLAGG
jgi:uncharacterized protein (DUF697 family)